MKREPFKTLLVANRGEIAVRILRGAREAGLRTVAVYSEADRTARHVLEADRAVLIGPAAARESYLRVEAILEAARRSGAEAIHPGYGFLSENPRLAEAVEAAGLVFVGPPADAIRRMGSKSEARRLAEAAGVPVIPGYDGDEQSDARLLDEAARIGHPLLIKPSAGGGGKGMRRVEAGDSVAEALAAARREALSAFGDDHLILERYLEPVRHVEIQVFADAHGNVIHLRERECSIQRRHQKVFEESPSTALDETTRRAMGEAAIALTRAVGYRSAGTIEFVLSPDRSFHFLEMNTRLQVEHPVTEAVTGIDLVRLQLREAMGEPLGIAQQLVSGRGHAIEARLYAEDPANGFLPSAGRIVLLREPQGPGIRVDSGIVEGGEVGVHYDPILAKIIAHGDDRKQALERLARALAETVVFGLATNLGFLRAVLASERFQRGETYTNDIDTRFDLESARAIPGPEAWALAALTAEGLAPASRVASLSPGAAFPADPASPWTALHGFRLGAEN
ncbi:MAG: hypothetical protein IT349_16770 [Candidatus Eisenbacteria bacterium]|nr:hypothetical protein [Candidatus Eisenbacteria bacterium]